MAMAQRASDAARQAEEMEALRAIYPEEMREIALPPEACSAHSHLACTHAMEIALGAGLVAHMCMPRDYPSLHPPEVSLRFSPEWDATSGGAASPVAVASLLGELRSTEYDETVAAEDREGVMYQWAEWLRARMVEPEEARREQLRRRREEEALSLETARALQIAEAEADEAELDQRVNLFEEEDASTPHTAAAAAAPSALPSILTGPPLTDRRSTFQAHAAIVTTPAEAAAVRAHLLSNPKIARATHNMWAQALHDATTGVWRRDCDDDGESGAGSRMAHLLQCMNAENILMVVSRWYGGVHLGSDRFKHINSVARVAVEELMRQQQQAAGQSSTLGRMSDKKSTGGKSAHKW